MHYVEQKETLGKLFKFMGYFLFYRYLLKEYNWNISEL